MHGAQIPLDAADGIAPFSRNVAMRLSTLTPRRWRPSDARWALGAADTRPGDEDMLGDLHRNHRQLDDFPGALARPVRDSSASVFEAVASLLAGLLPPTEAGHSGRAARAWPSSSATNRCSRTVACSWAMMAISTSRSTVVKSKYPCPITTATRASVRQPAFGQFNSKSEQLH